MSIPKLLIIDDDESIHRAISYLFKSKGYETLSAGTVGAGIKHARAFQPDLIILDYRLPDKTGIEAIESIKEACPESMVIMLTAYANIPNAVEAIRKGAFDYLTKPVDINALEIAAERALQMQDLRRENQLLRDLNSSSSRKDIIGSSNEINKLMLLIEMLAENPDTTVLIQGESGTGKEVVARNIHLLSKRRDKPFIDINCASLSDNLLESELFGHERGAFTDAKGTKKGLLEVADGGALFLDEIGELPLLLQPKLLRVLENKSFRRVGGTREIRVDVRIMAATNRSLLDMVGAGKFREDLYYRLCVMPIDTPPLRDRGDDILLLASFFIKEMSMGVKKKISGLTPESERYLRRYNWPGNVRELKNVIERAVILSPGPLITPEHLPIEIVKEKDNPSRQDDDLSSLDEMERKYIARVLARVAGNHSQAARTLGISRTTLLMKLKKYSL